MTSTSKVLVLGLDGATWDLLMPLAREGFLPNLSRLIASGTYGELESSTPPITAPAWASFATGKNPGKTGIFDFMLPRSSLDDLVPVTSKDIGGKTFYEILNDNGRRTIIVNLPLSYPPRTGSPTITSILTQGDQFIFPAGLKEKIPELAEYRLVPNFDLRARGRYDEYFQDIRDLESGRFTCAQKLFEWEWDFLFFLFSGIDWIQHEVYDKLISGSLGRNHAAFQLFCDVDSYLGWFLERLPRETPILIMSDHGFRVYRGFFYINQWLKENGFLECHYVRKGTPPHQHRFVEGAAKAELKKADEEGSRGKLSFTLPSLLVETLQRLRLGKIYSVVRNHVPIRLEMELAVDHARSRAVVCHAGAWGMGIHLNLTERFKDGFVKPEDAGQIKQEIISGLRELKDPTTGEDALDKVLDGEETYSGERAGLAPDIVILPRDFWLWPGLSSSDRAEIFGEKTFNGHSMSGIFLAYGPGIRKGHQLHSATIYDLAPTILHILGIPVPRDMDGKVLNEVFEHDSEFANRPIEYTGTDEREQVRRRVNGLKRSRGI